VHPECTLPISTRLEINVQAVLRCSAAWIKVLDGSAWMSSALSACSVPSTGIPSPEMRPSCRSTVACHQHQ
jgi:hypothetical protein